MAVVVDHTRGKRMIEPITTACSLAHIARSMVGNLSLHHLLLFHVIIASLLFLMNRMFKVLAIMVNTLPRVLCGSS